MITILFKDAIAYIMRNQVMRIYHNKDERTVLITFVNGTQISYKDVREIKLD